MAPKKKKNPKKIMLPDNINLEEHNTVENRELMIKATEFIEAMERCSIFGMKNQAGFFQRFLILRNNYLPKKNRGCEEENDQKSIVTTTEKAIGTFTAKTTT